MKNILIAGASGMVGQLLLQECLSSANVAKVFALVRRNSTTTNDKLQEIIIEDFSDYAAHQEVFQNIDAAFFCIGAYTGEVPDALFKTITVDFAIAFAKALQQNSPTANLCLLSGAGADRTEKSRTAFARYKGMAENGISALVLNFYTFRPGYIYPVTRRKEPNLMYRISRRLYPIIKLLGKNASIKSTELAHAMFIVGLGGTEKEILENRDILELLETVA